MQGTKRLGTPSPAWPPRPVVVGDSHRCRSGDWGRIPCRLPGRRNGRPRTSCGSWLLNSSRSTPSWFARSGTAASANSATPTGAACGGCDRGHCGREQVLDGWERRSCSMKPWSIELLVGIGCNREVVNVVNGWVARVAKLDFEAERLCDTADRGERGKYRQKKKRNRQSRRG